MTAQNMGKKILVDAGFEVVPVSNGAAAIKKIAETKPDIIILDIYMPGYTGLEVCDKVKAAPETANVPVLLTVGKLEPYRPEEGAKVKAEGVIIKPFEATDLLTALGRIAQKYNLSVPQIEPIEIKPPEQQELPPTEPSATASAPASYEETMRLSTKDFESLLGRPAEAAMAAAAVVPAAITEATQKIQIPGFVKEEPAPVVEAKQSAIPEAPAPMFSIEETPFSASAPAYNIADLTSSMPEAPAYIVDEIAEHPQVESPSIGAHSQFKASSVPDETGAFNIGGMGLGGVPLDPEPMYSPVRDTEAAVDALALEFSANTAAFQPAAAAPAATEHELETFAPAVNSEVHAIDPELETTAAAKVEGSFESLAELETTNQQGATEVPNVVDPALVTSPDELMQFTIKVGTDKEEVAVEHDPLSKELVEALYTPTDVAAPVEETVAEAAAPAEPEVSPVPHTYEDDPLVQMGVISIQPGAEASPELVNEFNKPVVEEDEPAFAQPAAEAVQHAPLAEPEAAPQPVIEVPAPAAFAVSEDGHLAKQSSELHDATSNMEPEPHVPAPEPIVEVAAAAMAAAASVPLVSATGAQHEGLAASLSAALDSVAHVDLPEVREDPVSSEETRKSVSSGLDAMQVARAVQRVFERYKEKMVADIADELSKGE